MTTLLIRQFGESEKDCWYQEEGKERTPCNEAMIEALWSQWVVSEFAQRRLEGDYVVFAYTKPVECNL